MKREIPDEVKQSCLAFAKHLLAAGSVWKDCTTYSRDAKEKIPTAFETTIGGCRISITCGHIYYPGEFIFHCHKLGFDTKPLNVTDAQSAAEKAFGICRTTVQKLNEAFSTCG